MRAVEKRLDAVMMAAVLLIVLAVGAVSAQPAHEPAFKMAAPEIRLPLMDQAPQIDGVIHAEEWGGADRMQGFTQYGAGSLTAQQGGFWVGADEKNLYVALRTETPPEGKILKRAHPVKGGASTKAIFADDSIEVWVAPRPTAPVAERRVYHGIFNAKRAMSDAMFSLRGGQKWSGNWTVKNSVQDDHWNCEIAIPWADFGITDSPQGKTMAVRVVRNWRQTADPQGLIQSEWGMGDEAFASLSSMPRVTWDSAAPVVQVTQLQAAPGERIDIRLNVANPGTQPLTATVKTRIVPTGSAATNYQETVTLAPGQDQMLTIHGDGVAREALDTRIQVASEDGQTVYYLRDFTWQIDRPKVVWNLNPEANKRIGLDFAYFPSHDAIHVRMDLSNLKSRGQVEAIELSIREKGAADSIARITMPPMQEDVSELRRWDVPALDEGEYELVAMLRGVPIEPIIQPFIRHAFEWEGNKLGTSDIVVPPFTPIKVSGDHLSVILRDHQMNDVGLWDQVIAAGKPLLAAPIRIEAVIDGQTVSANGQVNVVETSDTRTVFQADWQAGTLQGTTQSTWDYDGMMKSVLTLEPASQTVDRLTLVIPLDGAMAPLMHAVTFGNKFNYAGRVPEGQGVIWRSAQAPANKLIGTYVPYIWLGAQGPGVAVFGDNDAGWITDGAAETSCQEIVRTADGDLELRLHLIQKSATWNQPRKITLGFQATPSKPMPENWRLWTVAAARTSNAGSHAEAPGMYKQGFFGSRVYLGGITSSSNVYPGDKHFGLWEEFARLRETGELDRDFLDQWAQVAYKRLREVNPERAKNLKRATLSGLISMATQPQGVLIYTNARGMRPATPAGQTFINEWHRQPFPQRRWPYNGNISYGVEPVASYRDSRTWYYHKSLSMFTDGIYWDCVFLQPSTNPITSSAYVRPDGRVQPSAGLWHMRELVKRGAVLAEEMGKTNRNMVHMSGAQIVPINGFSATQADWELKYGQGDFQDKFPRDYIQAQTIGIQGGLVPIVLLNHKFIVGTEQEAAWQYRTAAAVMLSHELKPWSSRGQWAEPDPFWANYDRLVTFGYGQPGVNVYNYWQSDYPAQINGQSASLIVSKPEAGQAMLVLCDYGDGGTFTVELDVATLSLAGELQAVNVETDEPVQVADHTLTVDLKKHDFKVIRIVAQHQ